MREVLKAAGQSLAASMGFPVSREVSGWDHPCRPERFGSKHKRLLAQQFGRWTPKMDAEVALGRWYVIGKPEHIVNPMSCDDYCMMLYSLCVWDRVDPPYWECPFCRFGNFHEDKGACLVMHPQVCLDCGRVGFVYWPEVDGLVNADYYDELVKKHKPKDRFEAWDRYGIPPDCFHEV